MFNKLLIANRGEIACRIVRTAKRMGIASVAVYADVDSAALHVKQCDESVALGGVTARESYLDGNKILLAAKQCGAQMIHPGYGFLSENADFAERCHAAGITFIGPSADAIRIMGSKSAARHAAVCAHIPVLPGYDGERQEASYLQQRADEIGYPLLIKAVAGGGGKGMRLVAAKDEWSAALESVKRESQAAFADDRVMLEKFLPVARHIEVQIFADQHGNIVHLYERDCSMQRRHQKIVEESPAVGMSKLLRERMTRAAVDCARAIEYVGAGTIEFLLAADDEFYFMEMNTRLQVEHGVTEMVSGQDLVEWQIRIARGESLPCSQAQLSLFGHAIEARIYAENPEQQFLPATGTVHFIRHPDDGMPEQTNDRAGIRAGIRVDSGIQTADVISSHYDPMISKLMVWGECRADALAKMARALGDYQILGVHNNLWFLGNLIRHPLFQEGKTTTRFVEAHYPELVDATYLDAEHLDTRRLEQEQIDSAAIDLDRVLALACCYELSRHCHHQIDAEPNSQEQHTDCWSPWRVADGWQNNLTRTISLNFDYRNQHIVVGIEFVNQQAADEGHNRATLKLNLPSATYATAYQMSDANHIQLIMNGQSVAAVIAKAGDDIMLHYQGRSHQLKLVDYRFQEQADEAHSGTLNAPMPGLIIAVTVKVGEKVSVGTPLLIVEAMKMEHQIKSPKEGVVKALHYATGDQVQDGDALLVIE